MHDCLMLVWQGVTVLILVAISDVCPGSEIYTRILTDFVSTGVFWVTSPYNCFKHKVAMTCHNKPSTHSIVYAQQTTILRYRRNYFYHILGGGVRINLRATTKFQVTEGWHKMRSIPMTHYCETTQKPQVSVTICLVHVNLYTLL